MFTFMLSPKLNAREPYLLDLEQKNTFKLFSSSLSHLLLLQVRQAVESINVKLLALTSINVLKFGYTMNQMCGCNY